MASLLTLLVLSAQPAVAPAAPAQCVWLNHVSQFDDAQGLHAARLSAIKKVQTPAFIFVDDTDTFLSAPTVPVSLLYGDELIQKGSAQRPERCSASPWSVSHHFQNPQFIHRAICNTAVAQAVARQLPQGEYYTEWMLYFLMAAWRGAVCQNSDFYLWQKRPRGMHTKVGNAMRNTSLWLLQNQRSVLAELNQTAP